MKRVYLSLPFYGKQGTISRVLETNNEFIRIEYDIDGKEKETTFSIPKNKKQKLIDNFYQDVQEYLIKKESYYRECKEKRLKRKINIQNLKIGKYISFGLISLSVPLCFVEVEFLSYLNILIAAFSTSTLVALVDLEKKYRLDKKRREFMREFDFYNKKFNDYRSLQTHNKILNPTKYSGLSAKKNYGNNLNQKKILQLVSPKNHQVNAD